LTFVSICYLLITNSRYFNTCL